MARNHIGVAFSHVRMPGPDDRARGAVEAIETLGHGTQREPRAVEIFRFIIGIDLARSERDRLAKLIANRKDQSIAERVIGSVAFLARLEQPGSQEDALIERLLAEAIEQAVPLLGSG